jgi:L-fucose isomerase-like protein
VLGWANRLDNNAEAVRAKRGQIQEYIPTQGIPDESLNRIARLGVVVENWMQEKNLSASAIQCWTAIEEFYGVVPCTIMSMMSNNLMPSACETDIAGTVAMMALAYASGKPSAIVDWNNNYGDDPDRAVIFHCSNLPKGIFADQSSMLRAEDIPVMDFQEILSGTVGKENAYGTVVGRVKAEPFTYLRVSTDDLNGKLLAYIGEGNLTEDPLYTFGGYGVVQVPKMQKLLNYICENGYEHHVAMNLSQTAEPVHEALSKYLGWEMYFHEPAR